MNRGLLVAFDPSEAGALCGIGRRLGIAYDLVSLAGAPVGSFGAERVFVADPAEPPLADGLAASLAAIADGYSHFAALSSMASKDVLARFAGVIDAAMVTDVVCAESASVFRRPIVAGTLIETVETLAFPIVLTVRPAGFPAVDPGPAGKVESFALAEESAARRVGASAKSGTRPDLSQAKVVVSGGRPLRDAETFERLIGGLADAFGGAAGATRAAVDSGIAPNELQVGQTGKIVAPDLYIAAGISGSTQHMAGIKDSKIIVAINKDPDAPIFEFADIGIVADLYDAIPALLERVGKAHAR